MGLDAIVYRNAAHIADAGHDDRFEVDQATGEVVPKRNTFGIPAHMLVAERQRLGSIDEIRLLREEVEKSLVDGNSLLIQKVLYSASHSGDVIAVSDIQLLCKELDVLRTSSSIQLQEFIAAMDALVRASRSEGNPIVFV